MAGYGYPSPDGVPAHPPYAGFWIRFLGHVLDSILYGLVVLPFAVASLMLFRVAFDDCYTIGDDGTIHCPDGALKGGPLALAIILLVVGAIVAFVLYLIHLGRSGQTWGRRIVGVKVVDRDRIEPIGMGRALGRTLFSDHLQLRVLPRLPLDVVGQAEADLAGQGRQQHRRQGLR